MLPAPHPDPDSAGFVRILVGADCPFLARSRLLLFRTIRKSRATQGSSSRHVTEFIRGITYGMIGQLVPSRYIAQIDEQIENVHPLGSAIDLRQRPLPRFRLKLAESLDYQADGITNLTNNLPEAIYLVRLV
jgi:hypothetical protein